MSPFFGDSVRNANSSWKYIGKFKQMGRFTRKGRDKKTSPLVREGNRIMHKEDAPKEEEERSRLRERWLKAKSINGS